MKFKFSKKWLLQKAKDEVGYDVGAGVVPKKIPKTQKKTDKK